MGKVHTKRQQIYKHNDRRTFSEPLCNVRDQSRKELVNITNDWFPKVHIKHNGTKFQISNECLPT